LSRLIKAAPRISPRTGTRRGHRRIPGHQHAPLRCRGGKRL